MDVLGPMPLKPLSLLAQMTLAMRWRKSHRVDSRAISPQVFNDEKDIAARTHMHNASCMAGHGI